MAMRKLKISLWDMRIYFKVHLIENVLLGVVGI